MSLFRTTIVAAAGALTVMVSLTVPPGWAQQGGRGLAACRTDLATFCAQMEAGRGKRMRCLIENQAKLQSACQAVVQQRIDQRADRKSNAVTQAQAAPAQPQQAPAPQAQPAPGLPPQSPTGTPVPEASPTKAAEPARGVRPMAACRADLQALCANVQAGGGAKMKCLTDNRAAVSPACNDALEARKAAGKEQRAEMRGACRDDAKALCATEKGPARRQCLVTNATKLSPGCAAALNAPRG